ncbi:AidA/PixA family protein [Streptomyces sp. NBC_00443]|uniref:AidA/PixA family protein n=1 Tax=Streptomyces sp. NBC_00443 TaxID=2975743 RepID=UPI002E22955A
MAARLHEVPRRCQDPGHRATALPPRRRRGGSDPSATPPPSDPNRWPNLRAEPGDNLKWRETTLSLGSDYKALLYRYVSSDNQHLLIRAPEIEVI